MTLKNVASQSIAVYAYTVTTGVPKTGDSANIVLFITKDWGSVTQVAAGGTGHPTEMDATNAPGWYKIALTQTETNADVIVITGTSPTANVQVAGQIIFTDPPNYTSGAIDSSGRFTANVTQIGGSNVTSASGVPEVKVQSIAANAITAAATASDFGAEVADAVLDRDMSTGTDSGSTTVRTPRQALRVLRNKSTMSGGTATVYKEDDSTASWTAAITTDASANPITAVDPAGP